MMCRITNNARSCFSLYLLPPLIVTIGKFSCICSFALCHTVTSSVSWLTGGTTPHQALCIVFRIFFFLHSSMRDDFVSATIVHLRIVRHCSFAQFECPFKWTIRKRKCLNHCLISLLRLHCLYWVCISFRYGNSQWLASALVAGAGCR